MTEQEMVEQIREMVRRVRAERVRMDHALNARIGMQVAHMILCAGGTLRPDRDYRPLLAKIYAQLQWKRDGHK